MRYIPIFFNLILSLTFFAKAQVTQLFPNQGLRPAYSLDQNKAILVSVSYNRLWVTDATNSGTFQLTDTLTYEGAGGVLNGKLIFAASSPFYGSELWITDGTISGTALLKDIYPGKDNASPHDDFALLNGYLYFSATAPGIGRELWRTNGTAEGTTLVKDIVPGPAGSGLKGTYNIFSTGSYLLLTTPTYTEGYELWRSDGTAEGTYLVRDINPGVASSDISAYQVYNNTVLFSAKTAANGTELWKTDGTAAGTQMVKDIRPGTESALNLVSFFPLNGKLLFVANDGASGEEFWVTDGTEGGTVLLKDIEAGNERSYVSTTNAVRIGNKLYFPAYNHTSGTELWETDGTPSGTKMIHETLPGLESGIVQLLPNTSADQQFTQPLFGGKQFFFLLGLPLGGVDLWKSDGTTSGTMKVKTIKTGDNVISNVSCVYTAAGLYFSADNGVNGAELWKSDGTAAGTLMMADINNGSATSDVLFSFLQVNNRILFEANDGDGFWQSDLYRLDVNLGTLPIKMGELTATLQQNDALLKWYTVQEEGSREFVVGRSEDGVHFQPIGRVKAAGHSSAKRVYSFVDAAVANGGKSMVYYRLQMVDGDGKNAQSGVVALKLKTGSGWHVQLLGNPVQGDLKLGISGGAGQLQFSIRDAAGRTVKSVQYKGDGQTLSIAASGLLPGTYFLLAEGEGRSDTIKFMKL